MYNAEVIKTLSLLLIIVSLATVETRDLRRSSLFLAVQALLICALILAFAVRNPALYVWAGVAFATKAVIIPWLLLHNLRGQATQSEKAIIGFGPSVFVASVVLFASYQLMQAQAHVFAPTPAAAASLLHTHLPVSPAAGLTDLASAATVGILRTNLAVSLTVFVLGLYAILSRRDAIKTVIGLCLLENAVHLSLVSLAPGLRETALIGIVTEVVVTIYLLLYIIAGIREKLGTTDTFALSELHW